MPGSFDSVKGGKAKLGTGTKPRQKSNAVSSAALKLSSLSDAAFRLLPAERRLFWRNETRKAAAADDEGSDEGESEG